MNLRKVKARRKAREKYNALHGGPVHLFDLLICRHFLLKRGSSPMYPVEGAATFVCSTAKPDSRERVVCAVLLNNPLLPDRSDFVGS